MHEMALAQGILDIVTEAARAHNATRITAVTVRIGDLSHVEPQALRFGFEVVTRDTLAQDAALKILRVPGKAHCMICDQDVTIASRADPCPQCGKSQLLIVEGDDMAVQELEAV